MQNLFGFIIHPMELGVVWLALFVGNAGIGIILFTIFVRVVLSPLNIIQLRNARAMQRLQPRMSELRKKHGKDREVLQKETMALYKEHGVNPAMGCLPMVIQLPILFGLFYALMHLGTAPTGWPDAINWTKSACNGHTIAGAHKWAQWFQYCYGVKGMPGTPSHVWTLFHAKFLWLSNGLGQHDPLYILPLLAGVTQWVQSRMMLVKSDDPQQQMMNSMMNFMPLFIIFFAARYASGLSLYWVTSTLIGILIQYRITGWGLVPIPWGKDNTRSSAPQVTKPAKKPAPPTTLAAPTTEVEPDGENGATAKPVTPRPRKKANRARGGKGSGRRG